MDTLQTSLPYSRHDHQANPLRNPFKSFWMGGYECCDMLNRYGNRTDLLAATRHIERIEEDYSNLALFNIKTVREGIVWSKVEYAPYCYNWDDVDTMINAGVQYGVQQVWDICHFGMPGDLSPVHPHFAHRLAAICQAFASRYQAHHADQPLVVTPINEVSFLSWLGGEVGATTPYALGNGWHVKYQLCKAYIRAIDAIKSVQPSALILTTEPLVNIVPPVYADELQTQAARQAHEDQFQVVDMLCGKICPELGGSLQHVDIIGYNYYFNNQFSCEPGDHISWCNDCNDERFVPLHRLLAKGYYRYGKPILLSETSHPLEHRPDWLLHIARECDILLAAGLPLWGVCWYPLLNRPDWDETHEWHHSGLWEVDPVTGERSLVAPVADAFRQLAAKQLDLISSI